MMGYNSLCIQQLGDKDAGFAYNTKGGKPPIFMQNQLP
jgi:hypothetical protein